MPPTTFSSLEAQETIPRGEVLRKLADFFRVPLSYFYADSTPSLKPTDAARDYLRRLREPISGPDAFATQANVILDDGSRQKLAELFRRKIGETTHKQR